MFDKQYSDKCLILRLSILTQFSINLLPWHDLVFIFWWTDEQMYLPIWNRWNRCVINFNQLINTIDINRIRFTDFHRFIDSYRLTTPGALSTSRGGYGSKGNTACCDCTATLPTKRQQAVLRRTFLSRVQWHSLRTDNFAYIIQVDIVNNTSSHGIMKITWQWIILKPINRFF